MALIWEGIWGAPPFWSGHIATDSSTSRLDVVRTSRIGTLAMFCAALLVSAMWRPSAVHGDGTGDDSVKQLEHAFSGGVVFSIIMLAAGMESHLLSDCMNVYLLLLRYKSDDA